MAGGGLGSPEVVVLPTPPLPEATATMCRTSGMAACWGSPRAARSASFADAAFDTGVAFVGSPYGVGSDARKGISACSAREEQARARARIGHQRSRSGDERAQERARAWIANLTREPKAPPGAPTMPPSYALVHADRRASRSHSISTALLSLCLFPSSLSLSLSLSHRARPLPADSCAAAPPISAASLSATAFPRKHGRGTRAHHVQTTFHPRFATAVSAVFFREWAVLSGARGRGGRPCGGS